MMNRVGNLLRKFLIAWGFMLAWGLFSLSFGNQNWDFSKPLQAQVGIDFNQGTTSGTLNLAAYYRMYHSVGDILPADQSTLHLGLNGYFWLSQNLSTRFSIGLGVPFVSPEGLSNTTTAAAAEQSLFFYEGEFAMRFTVLKANSIAMMLGVLMDASEGHTGHVFLFNQQATNAYLQTSLGVELEMAFALGLEYLFYFRLKVPMSTYNVIANSSLEWGFYPRQGSLELAFLFHKGPSFRLSKAARNIYFGPFYRFDTRVLSLTTPKFVLSHTIGVTYYVKPPF